jgi:predicted aspartyl protease
VAALMLVTGVLLATVVAGESLHTIVPMRDNGGSTYYVDGTIDGFVDVELMVDTGSAYMTINEEMLEVLRDKGLATYVKKLSCKLADGTRTVAPVYVIPSVKIGESCQLTDVEVAVLPGTTRTLLGVSALEKAGPFIFSTDPPELVFSRCKATAH